MKLKLLVATSVSLIMAGNAKAVGTSRSLEGLSLGAQFGYITQDSKLKQRFHFTPFHHKKKDLSGRGVIGGLNLAYGYIFTNHLFLGIEIKGELSNLKGKESEGPFDTFQNNIHLKMKNSYGGSLKFGGVISSILSYLKVGVVSSQWQSSSQFSVTNDAGGGKRHKRLTGLELGIGVEIPLPEPFGLCDRLTIGGEFTHVEYKSLSYQNKVKHSSGSAIQNAGQVFGDCGCEPLFKVSAKPRTNAFMLRLRYRFY